MHKSLITPPTHLTTMNPLLFFCIQITLISSAAAQVHIPMLPAHWTSLNGNVAFTEYKSTQVMQITSDQELLIANELTFENGTIEFDVEMTTSGFSIYFRRASDKESEVIYLRSFRLGNATAPDVLQYSAITNGVLLWDLHGHYQGPADHAVGEWNHVKLVVSGQKMLVYINDMHKPVLRVPHLEGNSKKGGIAFEGASTFANLVIKHDEVEGLSPESEYDPTAQDPRYLRQWEVTQPIMLPYGHELISSKRTEIASPYLPTAETSWSAIEAERLGLINLSRQFGESADRRAIWLMLYIESNREQIRYLDLGFSDEVWVALNRQLAYVDKNTYLNPIMKAPQGRISIENTKVALPLRAGSNQLLIGVANDFWGWGIIARLDDTEGITISNTPK